MSLSVKLFVKKAAAAAGSEDVEVRRFSVDEDVSTCYDYLLAKIRATVPATSNAAIKLYWKDEDGEMISFSGDEELIEALGHVTDGVLRIYVDLVGSHDASSTQPLAEFMAALSSLMQASCSGQKDGKSCDGKEKKTDDTEETCHLQGQELRQFIINTANTVLEPLGLQLVDVDPTRHTCNEEPAAGGSMTSSCDVTDRGCEQFQQVLSLFGIDTGLARSLYQQLTAPSLSA